MGRGTLEKRGARRKQVKPVILIVTEGSQTEPKYFGHFRTRQKNIDIRVVGSRSSAGETDYMSLVRKAIDYKNKNGLSKAQGDTIWVVADADVNYNNPNPIADKEAALAKVRKQAQQHDISIALSNPCFELWYLLHFQYTTAFLKDYEAVKVLLKQNLHDYEKSGDVFHLLLPYISEAVQRAKRLEEYHLQNGAKQPFGIKENPATNVYQLVEELQ